LLEYAEDLKRFAFKGIYLEEEKQTFYNIPIQPPRPPSVEKAYTYLNGLLARKELSHCEIGGLCLIVAKNGSRNVHKFPFYIEPTSNVGILVYNYTDICTSVAQKHKTRSIKVEFQECPARGKSLVHELRLVSAGDHKICLGQVGDIRVRFTIKKTHMLVAFLRAKATSTSALPLRRA
jgi:hypothetical protein